MYIERCVLDKSGWQKVEITRQKIRKEGCNRAIEAKNFRRRLNNLLKILVCGKS
jgi:hypothetical protein